MVVVEIKGISASGRSFKGAKHQKNDDRFIIKALDSETILMAVSDGMGGHPAGDIAAEDVIASLDLIAGGTENNIVSIVSAIDRADVNIRNRVRKALILEGMGATVTAVILNRQKVWWGHVGDSRLYLMRNDVLRQITRDHSFLQDFIDNGELSTVEALSHPMAHVLDQSVGCLDSGADCGSFDIVSGDFILLTTDGLCRALPDKQIGSTISSSKDVSSGVSGLLSQATEMSAPDDTTVIIAQVY